MPERPSIIGIGTAITERVEDRLYDVEMANGHHAVGVVPRHGPRCDGDWQNQQVQVAFSPYDMSRCRIVAWLKEGR